MEARPIDIINSFSTDKLNSIKVTLKAAQDKLRKRSADSIINYKEGEVAFVKRNKILQQNKRVQKDLGTAVLVENRKVPKDN